MLSFLLVTGCGTIRLEVPKDRDVRLLEEDEPAALKAYAKARSLDEANLAAQRWERHVKRGVKKGGGKPKSFLDKLMTTKISLGKGK